MLACYGREKNLTYKSFTTLSLMTDREIRYVAINKESNPFVRAQNVYAHGSSKLVLTTTSWICLQLRFFLLIFFLLVSLIITQ